MNLFNEAEQETDLDAVEPEMEEIYPKSYKRKKSTGKKEENLSSFETTEVIKHKLEREGRFCPECGTKYKVATTETVKYLKFIPARFEVVEETTYVYSCPKCGTMKRPQTNPALLKGRVAPPSFVTGIMNAKYVNGMPLARQEREFARYDLNLSTKTVANWCIVLISNVGEEVSGKRELLQTYKGQQVVEISFRELKSPSMASVIYLKNPERIQTLSMLLSFALLVRAIIQYRMRRG